MASSNGYDAEAIERPVRHRRRRDRLGLRPPPDLHVHVRAVSEPRAGELDRPVLPARRAHRAADRAQQGRDPVPDGAGRLPATRSSARRRPIAARCSRTSRSRAAGRRIRSAPTPRSTGPGSGPTRSRRSGRPARCRRARRRWSRVPSPGPSASCQRRRQRASTTVRSPAIELPATVGKLTFRYYFAHSSNSSSADVFRAYVEAADGTRTLVREELGRREHGRPGLDDASGSR